MRNFKFRIWDKISKVFINNVVIDPLMVTLLPKEKYLSLIGECNKREKILWRFKIEPDDFEIQQSTGLFTETGEEVFEGDILKIRNTFLNIETNVLCVWEKWRYIFIDQEKPFFYTWSDISSEKKVIGNNFENPELLAK